MDFKEFKEKYQKAEVTEVHNVVAPEPVVSVLVQTYQHANYIRTCLDGILMQQTDFEFEILLGEDDSKDGTREICLEYAERYPDKIRLFLHRRENNIAIGGRPSGRFNFSYNLFSARGEYIAFCEGDDYWIDPQKLQRQTDFLKSNPEYNLTVGRLKKKHELSGVIADKKELNTKVLSTSQLGLRDYLIAGFSQLSTFMWRRKALTLPDWFITGATGDQAIVVLTSRDTKIHYDNYYYAVYRVHPGGVTSSVDYKNFRKGNVSLYAHFDEYTNGAYSTIIQYRKFLYKVFALTIKYKEGPLSLFLRGCYYMLLKIGIIWFNMGLKNIR